MLFVHFISQMNSMTCKKFKIGDIHISAGKEEPSLTTPYFCFMPTSSHTSHFPAITENQVDCKCHVYILCYLFSTQLANPCRITCFPQENNQREVASWHLHLKDAKWISKSFPLLVPTCRRICRSNLIFTPFRKQNSKCCNTEQNPAQPPAHSPTLQGSPGEFESVVQGSWEQQTIRSSAEGQAPDLFAVDGDVLTALQVGQAHHLNTTTCHRRRVKQIIAKQISIELSILFQNYKVGIEACGGMNM